jgi:hypothetical protein
MSDTSSAKKSSPFRRVVKFAFFGVIALILLVLLAVIVENWRGRRAWTHYRAEWEAKGERFDIAAFIPKPVPPEQNFAATPLLAPLLDYDPADPGKSGAIRPAATVPMRCPALSAISPGRRRPRRAVGRWEPSSNSGHGKAISSVTQTILWPPTPEAPRVTS